MGPAADAGDVPGHGFGGFERIKGEIRSGSAATATIMVSPTAREMPMMTAAPIPDKAAGNTTCKLVSNLVAPMAYAPSHVVRVERR